MQIFQAHACFLKNECTCCVLLPLCLEPGSLFIEQTLKGVLYKKNCSEKANSQRNTCDATHVL